MGDFNYDGIVNQDDYSLALFGIAESGGANISTFVPEPSHMLILPALWFMARRRRGEDRGSS